MYKKGHAMGTIKQTHTHAELGLSQPAYDEIKRKLEDAGYQHAFMEDGAIDMHGIGIALEHNPDKDQIALKIAEQIVKLLPIAVNPTRHKASIQVFIREMLEQT
jgi:hypothetical protein